MPQKTRIEADAENVRPPQAPDEHNPLAAFAPQGPQQAADLPDMHIGMGEALDAGIRVSRDSHDKGIVAGGFSLVRDCGGKRARARDDADPARRTPAAALGFHGLGRGRAHQDWLLGTQKDRSAFARMKATTRCTRALSGNV